MEKEEQGGDSADLMEIGKMSDFARFASMETSSSKRLSENRLSFVRSDEVSVNISGLQSATSASATVQLREGDLGAFSTGHTLLELSFAVSKDHVTLQSLTPTAVSEVSIVEENEMRAERNTGNDLEARWPNRPMPVLSSSCHSDSFREGMKTVGTMVKQFGNDLARSSRNASRVQNLGSPSSEFGVLDPELDDLIPIRMQKSTSSRAEYAIMGLQYINKTTATADQKKSWEQVEARFYKLANEENMLLRSDFAECIGACHRLPVCPPSVNREIQLLVVK